MDKKVNSFLEKARVSAELFANRTGRVATQAASTAGKTASNVVEATRLNLRIFDLNTEIEILYKEIGKMVYAVHSGSTANQDELQIKLELIDEKLDKIAAIREKLSQVKSTVTCPNCGRECGPDDTFCSSCGAQL